MPSFVTATTAVIRVSLAFNISATAECSAQKPTPHARSRQIPVKTRPLAVCIAAAQPPAVKPWPREKSPKTELAVSISDSISEGVRDMLVNVMRWPMSAHNNLTGEFDFQPLFVKRFHYRIEELLVLVG